MYGTQPSFGLGASDSYTFLVIASPSEVVISGALRVIIEREGSRAAEGGTGGVKVSGNYGASLQSTAEASAKGYSQPLWLDAAEHRYIEELSIMNFFAVIDGALYTSPLGRHDITGCDTRFGCCVGACTWDRSARTPHRHQRIVEFDNLRCLHRSVRLWNRRHYCPDQHDWRT